MPAPDMNRGHYIDDASGIEELEKRTAPKARIVEGIVIGSMIGVTFLVVLIAVMASIHFSK